MVRTVPIFTLVTGRFLNSSALEDDVAPEAYRLLLVSKRRYCRMSIA